MDFNHVHNKNAERAGRILACYSEDSIQKSQDNELEKSEGSRGGKVIGHTKSGKPIYESHSHESHKEYSADDHADAAKVLRKVANEKYKKSTTIGSDIRSRHEKGSSLKDFEQKTPEYHAYVKELDDHPEYRNLYKEYNEHHGQADLHLASKKTK